MVTFDKGLLPYSKLNRFLHPFMCAHALDNPHFMFVQNAAEPVLAFTYSAYFCLINITCVLASRLFAFLTRAR